MYNYFSKYCRSKKWNKFDVWALLLAGLPRCENSKLENIHFLAASNQISATDLADGKLVQDLMMLSSTGCVAFDAYLQQRVLVLAPILCMIGDNPRIAELLNHNGSKARMFCRICMVHFYSFTRWCLHENASFQSDNLRTPTTLSRQRTKGSAIRQMGSIAQATTETQRKLRRTQYGLKETFNPLFQLDIDLFKWGLHIHVVWVWTLIKRSLTCIYVVNF